MSSAATDPLPVTKPSDEPSLSHRVSPDARHVAEATALFRMLSDPTRLELVWHLVDQPADVTSLVAHTGATRTGVSQHLAKLRLSGLVVTRREGRRIVYSLADGHLARLVMEGLNHADHRVTGEPPHQ